MSSHVSTEPVPVPPPPLEDDNMVDMEVDLDDNMVDVEVDLDDNIVVDQDDDEHESVASNSSGLLSSEDSLSQGGISLHSGQTSMPPHSSTISTERAPAPARPTSLNDEPQQTNLPFTTKDGLDLGVAKALSRSDHGDDTSNPGSPSQAKDCSGENGIDPQSINSLDAGTHSPAADASRRENALESGHLPHPPLLLNIGSPPRQLLHRFALLSPVLGRIPI